MDLFRFTNPRHQMLMEEGEFLPRFDSVTWVERYRDAGEITIRSKPENRIREILPEGSLVSHVDSDEIMIIESHSVPDNPGEETIIETSGSSFEIFLHQRVVGSNHAFPTGSPIGEFVLSEAPSGRQAARLIEYHLLRSEVVNYRDALSYFEVRNTVSGVQTTERRVISRGSVYNAVMDVLGVDNLGIKSVRPRSGVNMALEVYKGRDRRGVIFSTVDGEIDQAEYLWSDRRLKNCALVSGRWLDTLVDDVEASGLKRRMMLVDGSDIDGNAETFPTGVLLNDIKTAMRARGREALAKQRVLALAQATAAPAQMGTTYGVDYTVGDIVTVAGSYDVPKPMRVTEYVHIQDNEGEQGYPSFEEVEEEETY
jgi:hypothetical protein